MHEFAAFRTAVEHLSGFMNQQDTPIVGQARVMLLAAQTSNSHHRNDESQHCRTLTAMEPE